MVNVATIHFHQLGTIMAFILQPWQLVLVVLAGWINRQQQEAIEYLRTENVVLREKLGKKRVLLNDNQRRRLAVKAKVLGRKMLEEIGTMVTPDTLLRWHRKLVAEKWDYSERRAKVGRPPVSDEVKQLVLKMARENSMWGYDRIQGALANLGHKISDQTVGNILKEYGIEPVPDRKQQTTWKTFLKAHWDCLAAVDFTTVEVWTRGGLVTYYLLFVMELATRRVHLAACTPPLGDAFMRQIARNLTDPFDGFLTGKRYILLDRDANFSVAFRAALEEEGVVPVRLPPRSLNLNPNLERFHLSVKSECLSKMIFFGEKMLRRAVQEYLVHYHQERNHQSLGNRIIEPGEEVGRTDGEIVCDERLGGLLRYYRRAA